MNLQDLEWTMGILAGQCKEAFTPDVRTALSISRDLIAAVRQRCDLPYNFNVDDLPGAVHDLANENEGFLPIGSTGNKTIRRTA